MSGVKREIARHQRRAGRNARSLRWQTGVTAFMQARIWLGVFVGSTIGGLIPGLWGADFISYSSVLLSGAGGLVGLWLGYKMS